MGAKWYIVYTKSGSENTVKRMILEYIAKHNMSELFEDVVVPVIEVPEVKKGKRVVSEKKFMPGYLLIKMQMTDESWHLVKSIPKVTDFLGSKSKPQPLSEKEVENIFNQIEVESKNAVSTSIYKIGEKVQVIDGPFDTFSGAVEEVDMASQRIKVAVSIFGKPTPIELSFSQVRKI